LKRRKKRPHRHGKRGIYILPNLFTSASLFGGFFAIIAAMEGRFEAAAAAILVSCLFDALDGKVARYTNSSSHFGAEYDSLSDLVAFGVAPALLAFQWALAPFGRLGWLACFLYVACGALRLARFNVQKGSAESGHFKGLPIPGAAGLVASLILFEYALDGGTSEFRHVIFIFLMYILSFLMVSTIHYPSFKDVDVRGQKPFSVLVAVILIGIVVAYKPKIMLFLAVLTYVSIGPAVMAYRHFRQSTTRAGEVIATRDAVDETAVADQSPSSRP
jgi:CDP-diacylglycerol---serine O-phosphatidyltransferase